MSNFIGGVIVGILLSILCVAVEGVFMVRRK